MTRIASKPFAQNDEERLQERAQLARRRPREIEDRRQPGADRIARLLRPPNVARLHRAFEVRELALHVRDQSGLFARAGVSSGSNAMYESNARSPASAVRAGARRRERLVEQPHHLARRLDRVGTASTRERRTRRAA